MDTGSGKGGTLSGAKLILITTTNQLEILLVHKKHC